MAELAGAFEDPKRPLDGVNLIPYLSGKNSRVPHEAIYLRKFDGGAYAVRKGDSKLIIKWRKGAPELYNLDEDIGEQNDLARQYPERVQQLDALRKQWDAQLIEPRFLGLIHTPEWQARTKRQQKAAKQKEAKEWDWFAALDANKDGLVTEAEWIARQSKAKGNDADVDKLKEYFADRDLDRNGTITREELDASMTGKKQ